MKQAPPLKKNDDIRLAVTAFSALGTGIGRHGGFTVFVDGLLFKGVVEMAADNPVAGGGVFAQLVPSGA